MLRPRKQVRIVNFLYYKFALHIETIHVLIRFTVYHRIVFERHFHLYKLCFTEKKKQHQPMPQVTVTGNQRRLTRPGVAVQEINGSLVKTVTSGNQRTKFAMKVEHLMMFGMIRMHSTTLYN